MAAEGSTQPDIKALPTETLQIRAAEQRAQLHRTAADLREKINETKEKYSVTNQVREHVVASSLLAGVVAALLGFGAAGLFTRS